MAKAPRSGLSHAMTPAIAATSTRDTERAAGDRVGQCRNHARAERRAAVGEGGAEAGSGVAQPRSGTHADELGQTGAEGSVNDGAGLPGQAHDETESQHKPVGGTEHSLPFGRPGFHERACSAGSGPGSFRARSCSRTTMAVRHSVAPATSASEIRSYQA